MCILYKDISCTHPLPLVIFQGRGCSLHPLLVHCTPWSSLYFSKTKGSIHKGKLALLCRFTIVFAIHGLRVDGGFTTAERYDRPVFLCAKSAAVGLLLARSL